ncbi:TetR/AcrR family transcriptional regulator [Haloglycomyces albus]|uniref:TetR/AcrR family transcriptional regulator n=1 Tax=Haloglycomyces albus TaxID=526067 RepID=UPI00046D4B50|nr:TetR/AcrR family transcriptional regulator [Haloglycomyces albus]
MDGVQREGQSCDDTCAQQGRPRSSEASRSILLAALDLLVERGSVGSISIEAIADRSGVSKATIYRRWSSKEELIVAAVDSIKAAVVQDLPHTSVRDDLIRLASNMRTDLSPHELAVFKAISLELKSNEKLREHNDRVMQKRRQFIKDVFQRGIERGEVRPDVDLDLAVVMFISPLMSVRVYENFPDLNSDDFAPKVVDTLLQGIGT